MHRRGFLGNVLGGFASCFVTMPKLLPAPPSAESSPPSLPPKMAEFLRAFSLSDEELFKYRLYLVTDKGERFFAPVSKIHREDYVIDFSSDNQPIFQETTFVRGGLISTEGFEYPERWLSRGPIRPFNGDCVALSFRLGLD